MLFSVMSKCDELHHSVDPSTVILDFEQGAISAVRESIVTHVRLQGCFYHLNQSTWKHIRQLGLATAYRESDQVLHFCGMIDAFSVLVGHSHPSVLVTIEAFQGDLAVVEHDIEQDARGQPPVKRQKRTTQQLQKRLSALCEDRRDGRKSVADTLRSPGHCIRFAFSRLTVTVTDETFARYILLIVIGDV